MGYVLGSAGWWRETLRMRDGRCRAVPAALQMHGGAGQLVGCEQGDVGKLCGCGIALRVRDGFAHAEWHCACRMALRMQNGRFQENL